MKERGFDTETYVDIQSKTILERVSKFGEKLYLEFGGKLSNDFHAARVLPGYQPNAKIQVLKRIQDMSEIYYCVSAKDIQRGRVRHDFGLSYDQQALKDIAFLSEQGLNISGVVITRYEGESLAERFYNKLQHQNIPVFLHREIPGYPLNIDLVVSEKGYGQQPYLPTKKPIVIVTGAGGGSGKMSVCLAQIYHETQRGISAGFAKFETFPIWNLPIDHPVNIAYEAATADLGDLNMVDQFHLHAYNQIAINYNRDLENFAILKQIFAKIADPSNPVTRYASPTDMGVNMAAAGIINDAVVREAGKQEIIRRYFQYRLEYAEGIGKLETVERVERLMKKAGVGVSDRKTVLPAREAAKSAQLTGKGNEGVYCGAAIELPDGTVVTGKNSPIFHAESAAVLNAIKTISGIDDHIHLLPINLIQNVIKLKENISGRASASLNLEETLIVLAISSTMNPVAEICLRNLKQLAGCEMHITHIPSHGDYGGLRKLQLNFTTDGLHPNHSIIEEEHK
ncbi:MAG TPA: DUF1846 family protein [Bacillota bacterium]|jgi:uncharacterized protein (UPF0371 family)|nr:DUF1846 family protein [Bacillota bacterium]HPT68175.1 DUF1846 family protein [Bacillota bacterium]